MSRWLCVLLVVPCLLAAAPPLKTKAPVQKKGAFGLQISADEAGAVVVMVVLADGPADKGGMKAGDVLERIGGLRPASLRAAVEIIGSLRPGKKVKVDVLRDGKKKQLEVEVGER